MPSRLPRSRKLERVKRFKAVWSEATKMNVPHNMTTTQFELHGYEVVQTLGMVRGIIVRSRSIFRHHWSQLADIGRRQYHAAD